jgi:hypothetical protein
MTTAGIVALAIAVFASFCYAGGSILQAVGARRSTTTVRALGHPLYLIGVALDLVAFAGSMVALRELAVYLVESVLAGSLAVTVVAARIFLKARLRARDVVAVVVSVAALTVLAMSAGPQETVTATNGLRWLLCSAAAGLALIGWGTTRTASPGAVAAVAGLSLGGAALAGRAMPMPEWGHPGRAALDFGTEPLLWALVVFAVGGMMLYTHALQHGQVGPVTAVLWIAEVIAPSAVALAILGDAVRPGWELPAMIAGLVTVGAAVLLAGASGPEVTVDQPEAIAAAPRPLAIAAAAQPVHDPHAERVIWWGGPPIWKPPARERPAVAAPPMAELEWTPPQGRPVRPYPRRPDTDAQQIPEPVAAAEPMPAWLRQAPRRPSQEPQHPWDDLRDPITRRS